MAFDDRDAFEDETFDKIDLAGRDLGGRELYRCTFRNAKLAETSWARTRLEECRFVGCDLTRARPRDLALRGVELVGCKLMGIDWTGVARFPDVTFVDCNLDYCSFVGLVLKKLAVRGSSFVEANFIDVDLGGARFEGCRLTGARFERCDLRAARFPDADGLLIDPAANQIKATAIPIDAAIRLAASFGFDVIA